MSDATTSRGADATGPSDYGSLESFFAPGRAIAPELGPIDARGELVLLARMLRREGYDQHLAGHITVALGDGTYLVNPYGLPWDEFRSGDVMRIDADGAVVEGRWTVNPGVSLHVAIHRARQVGVVVHNHSRWGTVWASIGRAPEIFDQTGALYHGKVAVYDEYLGAFADMRNADAAVAAIGDADVALLMNHGVVVLAADVRQAFLRAMSFEWRCRVAWEVTVAGGGRPMRPDVAAQFGEMFTRNPFPGLFEAMARRELRADPSIAEPGA